MAYLWSVLLPVLIMTMVFHAVAVTSNDEKPPAAPPNPSALLKHQTPIAGTNLFLNTPYKMVDRTRPGCYATWSHETYQDFKVQLKGVFMACTKSDQQWYNTPDASWIFERTDGVESNAEYNGTLKLKNLGVGLTLETWLSAGTWWVGIGGYAANPAEDMWNIRTDPTDKNNVQLEIQNWWLHTWPTVKYNRFLVYLKKDDPAGYIYSFIPSIDLEARMYDFVFTRPMDSQLALHSSRKDLLDSYDINNDSPATVARTISVSEKVINEFAWGFSESLKNFAKVKGEVGIPFIAKSEVEAGFELTLASNQNWKNTKEKLFSMSYEVKVPPRTNVRVSAWYELIRGISMDYTASTEITGNSTRITMFDDVVKETPATGDSIRKYLEYTKFDGKIVEIKEFSVIAQIKGTLVASVGVRGQLNVDGQTVMMMIVPQ